MNFSSLFLFRFKLTHYHKNYNCWCFAPINKFNQLNTYIPKNVFMIIKNHLKPITQLQLHNTDDFFKTSSTITTIANNYHTVLEAEITTSINFTAKNNTSYDKYSSLKPFLIV